MSSILNDSSSASQGISPNESTQENTSKVDSTRITPLLWNRDETDLILLKYVGEHDGVEINGLLPKMSVTYSALATRMSKMTDLGLLRRSKRTDVRPGPRPPYVYFLGTDVTLEAIEEVISRQRIDVKQFELEQIRKQIRQANKRNEAAVVSNPDDTLKEDLWQSTQSDQEEERNGEAHQIWDSQKLQQSQLEQEQEEPIPKNASTGTEVTGVTDVDNIKEHSHEGLPEKLSVNEPKAITLNVILEVFDETTRILLDKIDELDARIADQGTRIAELEKQLSLFESAKNTKDPREVLRNVRSRFNLETTATQNGKHAGNNNSAESLSS